MERERLRTAMQTLDQDFPSPAPQLLEASHRNSDITQVWANGESAVGIGRLIFDFSEVQRDTVGISPKM